ncbi:MAG: hypothetical protein ABEJ73_00255 [Haloplanus sp.]
MASADESVDAALGAGASRPASLVVAVAVGAGLALVAATGGAAIGVGVTALAGIGLGVAVLCRARDGPRWVAAASLLTPVVALGGLVGVSLVVGRRGVGAGVGGLVFALGLAAGAGLAAFGATGTLGDGIGTGAVRGVWRVGMATTTVVGGALGVVFVTRADALGGLPVPTVDPMALLGPVVAPAHPTVALASFAVLVVGAALAGRAALSTLPVVELAARRRRESVAATVDSIDDTLAATVTYGVLAACVSLLTLVPAVRSWFPVDAVAGLLGFPALRRAVLALAAVAGGVALVGRGLQAVTGSTASVLGRLLPATAGGVVVVLATLGGAGAVPRLVAATPPAVRPVAESLLATVGPVGVGLGVTVLGVSVLTGASTALIVAVGVGLVPRRGSGGALAGAGLTLCATVLGVGGAPALATVALVGLGVVAWDVSDQGVATRADLGPRSADRIEAVHAVGSVGVAAVGVAAAWALRRLVGGVAVSDGVLVGTVAAVAGAVLLLGVLRG